MQTVYQQLPATYSDGFILVLQLDVEGIQLALFLTPADDAPHSLQADAVIKLLSPFGKVFLYTL